MGFKEYTPYLFYILIGLYKYFSSNYCSKDLKQRPHSNVTNSCKFLIKLYKMNNARITLPANGRLAYSLRPRSVRPQAALAPSGLAPLAYWLRPVSLRPVSLPRGQPPRSCSGDRRPPGRPRAWHLAWRSCFVSSHTFFQHMFPWYSPRATGETTAFQVQSPLISFQFQVNRTSIWGLRNIPHIEFIF